MPIFAYSDVGLYHFTDLLHDLYFELPKKDLKPVDGRVCFAFRDEDNIFGVSPFVQFKLCVCEVLEVRIEGKPGECPDPISLTKIDYNHKEKSVVFKSDFPIQINFKVEKLHLELDQLM